MTDTDMVIISKLKISCIFEVAFAGCQIYNDIVDYAIAVITNYDFSRHGDILGLLNVSEL